MERQDLFDMIKYHFENKENEFIKISKTLSRDIGLGGDVELAKAINDLIKKHSKLNFSSINKKNMIFNKNQNELLKLITIGVKEKLINSIFIYGKPGTGKTTFVREIGNKLKTEVVALNMSNFIDSRLGESMKKLSKIFNESKNKIIFIDEIDSIAITRNTSGDLQEISRVLNTLLHLMDNLNKNNILIVATNLFKNIDKAFIRRFDIISDFDKYELIDIQNISNFYFKKYNMDLSERFVKEFSNLIKYTYKVWVPSYIEKSIKISKLWTKVDDNSYNPIISILNQLGLGEKDEEVALSLRKYGISLRSINYFTGVKKDNIIWNE